MAPGGALGAGFLPPWLAAVNLLKFVPNFQALAAGTPDLTWLADRVEHPAMYFDLLAAALFTPTVDAIPEDMTDLLDDTSEFRKGLEVSASTITAPTFLVGGWDDLFTNSAPTLYNDIPLEPGRKQLMVGEWYHMTTGSGLGLDGAPPRLEQIQRAWFDKWLKGIDNGVDQAGPVTVFSKGGTWHTQDAYPAPAVEYQALYLNAEHSNTSASVYDGGLSTEPPTSPARLTVTPTLASFCSRDNAQQTIGIGGLIDVCAGDSRIHEQSALTFTSAPMTEETELSGPIAVRLNTVHDATDGYWAVTVTDVAPDGRSHQISSGQLVSSLRALDEHRTVIAANGKPSSPVPQLTLAARQPVVPGEATTLDITLTPTEATIAPGHRIRVDVEAMNAPKGMPLRPLLNESGLRPEHLELDPAAPSWVNLPVVGGAIKTQG